MTQIIDGKRFLLRLRDELKEKVTALKAEGKEITLAVIQVGNDPASTVYVGNKKKSCAYIGIRSLAYELPEDTTEEETALAGGTAQSEQRVMEFLFSFLCRSRLMKTKSLKLLSGQRCRQVSILRVWEL